MKAHRGDISSEAGNWVALIFHLQKLNMSSHKIYFKLISGKSDSNINFNDLCNFLEYLGFTKRIKGSHYIFRMEGINKKITLQKDGTEAKSYQVKQVRKLIIENNLGDFDV